MKNNQNNFLKPLVLLLLSLVLASLVFVFVNHGRFFVYCCHERQNDFLNSSQQSPNSVDITGIGPFNLSMAPVPSINNEYNGVTTTSPATDKDGNILHFLNYHFDFSTGIKGCEGNIFDDLSLLGYAFMDGVPTAVTIVNEKNCGTGYFPSVVLYQASGACQESLSGCLKDTKIAGVVELYGSDRINITSIDIKPNHIFLYYTSQGDAMGTTAELEYKNGKFAIVGP